MLCAFEKLLPHYIHVCLRDAEITTPELWDVAVCKHKHTTFQVIVVFHKILVMCQSVCAESSQLIAYSQCIMLCIFHMTNYLDSYMNGVRQTAMLDNWKMNKLQQACPLLKSSFEEQLQSLKNQLQSYKNQLQSYKNQLQSAKKKPPN